MNIVLAPLLLIGYFLGGFAAAHIALRSSVPFLVGIVGERHFASGSAFDGMQAGFLGGIIAVGGLVLGDRGAFGGLSWLAFPFIAVVMTIGGLLYLRWMGADGKGREWQLVDGRILNNAQEELHPTMIREDSFYNQTGPFSGYSQYFLQLCSDDKVLGTNSYNSKNEFRRDGEEVRRLADVKWFDLVWLWRAEEKKWRVVHFPSSWTGIICGPLEKLTSEDREWWRQWVFPRFEASMGTQVDAADAKDRFKRFVAAYGGSEPDEVFVRFEKRLYKLLESEGPVIALDNDHFEKLTREVGGPGVILGLDFANDFVKLENW